MNKIDTIKRISDARTNMKDYVYYCVGEYFSDSELESMTLKEINEIITEIKKKCLRFNIELLR